MRDEQVDVGGLRPDFRTDSSAVVAMVFVANRYVSLPSIRM